MNPFIVASPSSEIQVQSVGDSVKFNCSARGSPLPKVKWVKDGRRVVPKAKHDGKDIITTLSRVTLERTHVCFITIRIGQRKPTQA